MLNQQLIERYCFLILSLEIISMGIIFINHANLGINSFSSFPYVLSSYFKLSNFSFELLLQILFIILQIMIFGKKFKKIQLFQLVIWLFLYLFLAINTFNNIIFLRDFYPKYYLIKIIFLLIGSFMVGIGINIQLTIKTLFSPEEGLLYSIFKTFHYNLCYIKISIDLLLIILSSIFSYFTFNKIIGIKEGTIISCFFIGYFIGKSYSKVKNIIIDFVYRNFPEKKG